MKVNIIGGGPSGLFLAILLKKYKVASDIRVYEQNPKGATYGFGVGLADSAIGKLADADPATFARITDRMYFINDQIIENSSGEYTLKSQFANGMISRLDLLQALQKRCEELGIAVTYCVRRSDIEQLEDVDLLVGADGANSAVRASAETSFGTRRETRENFFAWYGFAQTRKESGLRFRRSADGCMIAHYYSYTPDMWTFVAEVDQQSWRTLGMDGMTDAMRKALVEASFSDVLGDQPLIENRSIWTQFETVTNDRWFCGNKVLIGDALYRAHFSIGSGTRLAMQDALGLAEALAQFPGDVAAALDCFEARGKPRKQKMMTACENSYRWYESAHSKLDMPILGFIREFMDRTGRMPEERLRLVVPEFVDAYNAQVAAAGGRI